MRRVLTIETVWVASFVAAILIASAVSAVGASAGDAAHFLRDGVGARGRAMGSAYVASYDDYTASFWNPAPGVQTPSSVAGGGIEQRAGGLIAFSVLGMAHLAQGWGAGMVVLTSDLYDVYLASLGVRFGDASAGAGFKSYQFGIPGDSGSGWGFDLGARLAVRWGAATLRLAVVSRDVGWTSIRWGMVETLAVDRVAWVHRFGLALSIPHPGGEVTLAGDGELALRRPPRPSEPDYWAQVAEANISLGLAFRWQGLQLRAGIQRFDLLAGVAPLRLTFGVGIAIEHLSIDLALVPSRLGSTYLGGFQMEL